MRTQFFVISNPDLIVLMQDAGKAIDRIMEAEPGSVFLGFAIQPTFVKNLQFPNGITLSSIVVGFICAVELSDIMSAHSPQAPADPAQGKLFVQQ